MNDGHLGEENVGLAGNFVRCDDESDVSSQKRSCLVKACVDIVVGAAVAVDIIVFIATRAGVAVVIEVDVGIDKRCMRVVSIRIIRYVRVPWIVPIIFSITDDLATADVLISVVFILKLDSGVEHEDRSATQIRSHQYARINVFSLLFISIDVIIVYSVIEENVVYIVDTADTPLLREFAEFVLIDKDFLVLLTTDTSAKAVSWGVSYIGHVSFDPVIQLASTLIEDVHLQHPPVVIEAVTGPYSRIFVQGSPEERLEIFCGGVSEEGFGGFIDVGAESNRRMLASRSGTDIRWKECRVTDRFHFLRTDALLLLVLRASVEAVRPLILCSWRIRL